MYIYNVVSGTDRGGYGERNNFISTTLKLASGLGPLRGVSGERNNFILLTLKLASCLGLPGG